MSQAVLTVENTGVPIWDHRLSTGEVVTIPDNSCRDILESVYNELIQEYTWLKVIARSDAQGAVNGVKTEPVEEAKESVDKPEKNLDFIEGLKEASQYICSVCDRKFDTNQGMRIHMRKSHE